MSKVALLMAGQPRYVEQAFPDIYKNIIEPNNPDIFIHSWFGELGDDKPFRYGKGWGDQRLTKNADEVIERLYKPKRFTYEKQIDFRPTMPKVDFAKSLAQNYAGGAQNPECAEYYTYATCSMWKSIQAAWREIICYISGSEVMYDAIIKCRFDLGINSPVRVSEYDIKGKVWGEGTDRPELGINWMNFGDFESMGKICNIYNQLQELYDSTGLWCNEYFIKEVCKRNNIQWANAYWGLTLPSFPL